MLLKGKLADSSSSIVALYGSGNCHKTNFYREKLDGWGVPFHFYDITNDVEAASTVRAQYNGKLHFPVMNVKEKWLRNPTEKELIQILNREGVIDSGIIHDEQAQRFIKHMYPHDAFVSYQKDKNGNKITLSHIEVSVERRGSGFGARVALEVFEKVEETGLEARLTCPFLRKVASKSSKWVELFSLQGKECQ